MKYDGTIDLAIGASRRSKIWKNKKWKWSELAQRLSEENKTNETYKEYMAFSREDQNEVKDVGGYVGGYLRNGRRKPESIVHRQIMTLDIDFAHSEFWEDFTVLFGNAAILHSTHKHHENSPRYRLIIPLNRECSSDEYVAVSRSIAGEIGIDLFDSTTFEPHRLMYWPSNPRDIPYVFRFQDGPWVDVDEILGRYVDWTDSTLWPTSAKQLDQVREATKKQEDPENKKGLIGAFCRSYNIPEAIKKFLPDIYKGPDANGRYTYANGSTSAGLIVYEDKFAFSHHGTDPSGGKLCNSFDLVRIHLFGHMEDRKGFTAMQDKILQDEKVKKLIASENLSKAAIDFAEDLEEEDIEWTKDLELDGRGAFLSNAANLGIIFANDIRLTGMFRYNQFDGKGYVFGNLPWRRTDPPEVIRDVDYSGVRTYLDKVYGITGHMKIEDAMALELEKRAFHPIRDYIRSIEWDGQERAQFLLQDYFGAEDDVYHREIMKKVLAGAVARVFRPGVKFDLVLTLIGPQGTGKSTFVSKLGGKWFSDTFFTVQGKEAFEQVQGAWIIEMAELAGTRKAEVETVKHFISKQEDSFRKAYGRVSETYKRQCIFIGTTNDDSFLRDTSGNRRFLPVSIQRERSIKDVFTELDEDEVAQIWAEAYVLYKKGEPLFLSGEAEKMAKKKQSDHTEGDDREGIIAEYLDTLLPPEWSTMDLTARRVFLEDPLSPKGTEVREQVCSAEIWCECFGNTKKDMDRYRTRAVNDMLKKIPGWKLAEQKKTFPLYGRQRYYEREKDRN